MTIATIQTDRKLLQDNIAMRVRYGWAFIALIVSLLLLISVPQDSQVDFQPKETYLLSVICLVTSIVLILMGLFSSHYGSSYKLFTNHGPIDDLMSCALNRNYIKGTLQESVVFTVQRSINYGGLCRSDGTSHSISCECSVRSNFSDIKHGLHVLLRDVP